MISDAIVRDLLTWLISVSGGATVLLLLTRSLGQQLLSRDIERYRAALQRSSAVELERLKAELARSHTEHETQFRWLHSKRTQALDDVYAAWIAAYSSVQSGAANALVVHDLTHGSRPEYLDVPVQATRDALEHLVRTVNGHRPHIPTHVQAGLVAAIQVLTRAAFAIELYAGLTAPGVTIGVPAGETVEGHIADAIERIQINMRPAQEQDEVVASLLRAEFGSGGMASSAGSASHVAQ